MFGNDKDAQELEKLQEQANSLNKINPTPQIFDKKQAAA